jgi:hypothetical protein
MRCQSSCDAVFSQLLQLHADTRTPECRVRLRSSHGDGGSALYQSCTAQWHGMFRLSARMMVVQAVWFYDGVSSRLADSGVMQEPPASKGHTHEVPSCTWVSLWWCVLVS